MVVRTVVTARSSSIDRGSALIWKECMLNVCFCELHCVNKIGAHTLPLRSHLTGVSSSRATHDPTSTNGAPPPAVAARVSYWASARRRGSTSVASPAPRPFVRLAQLAQSLRASVSLEAGR